MSVGDVNSTARGSGARFNDGKPPLELIPLAILARAWDKDNYSPAQERAYAALEALGQWQAGGDEKALYEALRLLGNPFHDAARVLDYGRQKYSKRGHCTCGASEVTTDRSAHSASGSPRPGGCAGPATTSSSRSKHPSTASDSERIDESGISLTPSAPRHTRGSETQGAGSIQSTSHSSASPSSSATMASPPTNTGGSSTADAGSAAARTDRASTIVTAPDECADAYAIPATSPSASSSAPTTGWTEHSPTCGVRQIVSRGDWNWLKGMAWSIPLGCATRHIEAILAGEEDDPESGFPHAGHVACNLIFLITYSWTFPEGDDRPKMLTGLS